MADSAMPDDDDYPATLVVQLRVDGFGTEDDFDERCLLQEKLDSALQARGQGCETGGDCGGNTMNIFLAVREAKEAMPTVRAVLEEAGMLSSAVIAEILHGQKPWYKVWWPDDYDKPFDYFGEEG
jgi:hypothetical protein